MKSKLIVCITFLCALTFNGYAQKAGIRKADKNYDRYAYIDAIKTYERIAEKGYKSPDMFQKLEMPIISMPNWTRPPNGTANCLR